MKKIILLILMTILVSACSTTNTAERANPQSSPQMVDDKRVITDSDLNDYAYIASINESRENGLLKIQARLVNSTSARRSVNYKFSWVDKNGMEVSSPTSNWVVITLAGGEAKYISSIATNPNVVDFSLKLLPVED